ELWVVRSIAQWPPAGEVLVPVRADVPGDLLADLLPPDVRGRDMLVERRLHLAGMADTARILRFAESLDHVRDQVPPAEGAASSGRLHRDLPGDSLAQVMVAAVRVDQEDVPEA